MKSRIVVRTNLFFYEKKGNLCHKILHLFSCFCTKFLRYEALPESKNPYWCTSSNTTVKWCPMTMIMKCPSISLYIGMQKRKRRATEGMVKNLVYCCLFHLQLISKTAFRSLPPLCCFFHHQIFSETNSKASPPYNLFLNQDFSRTTFIPSSVLRGFFCHQVSSKTILSPFRLFLPLSNYN